LDLSARPHPPRDRGLFRGLRRLTYGTRDPGVLRARGFVPAKVARPDLAASKPSLEDDDREGSEEACTLSSRIRS